MSSSSISGLSKSYYTYGKRSGASVSSKKASESGSSATTAVSTATITNESGDSISLSKIVRDSAVSAAAAASQTEAEGSAEAGISLDTDTSEKINSMLDEAEKVADLYEQSLSQMSTFSDFLKASLNSNSDAGSLYKALGLDSASTFATAMSSLQSIVNERYSSLSDSILSAAVSSDASSAALTGA